MAQSLLKTRPILHTNLPEFFLHTANGTFDNLTSFKHDVWRNACLIWLNLLKLACSSGSYSNCNKTLKPMQDFNGWNVEEMTDGHRWEEESE